MTHGLSILMYHQVGAFAPMREHRSTYCDVRRFAAQMAWLHRFGYSVLRLDDALDALAGRRPLPPRAVVITFDDGYENFYTHAWPVLERHGFPATVYLIAGMLGQPSHWFAADGRDTPPLMGPERIRELHRAGVDFGSHSVTHAKLTEIDHVAARQEIEDSKAMLEDVLGAPVRHFCYPFGRHDRAIVELARAAGYASGTTCVRATAQIGWDALALPRKAVSYGDSALGMAYKLHFKHAPKPRPGEVWGPRPGGL
ncbi:MAG: polysaccharide deacetylase family protein [Chromatiales bacterium]|nr:polysaccharide deacetylase family protein [Chromatiales bacterium]